MAFQTALLSFPFVTSTSVIPYASTLLNPLLNVISGYEGCSGYPCDRDDWVVRSARSLVRLHGCSRRRRSKGLYVDIMTMLCLLADHLCEKFFASVLSLKPVSSLMALAVTVISFPVQDVRSPSMVAYLDGLRRTEVP